MSSVQDKLPENAGLHKHGMFAEEKHAIETLKLEMADVFQGQNRRYPIRSLYFNQLWEARTSVIATAMLSFFNASSAMRAIVETAIEGQEEAVKIQAVLIGLLATTLVQNVSVISGSHVSDRLINRTKAAEEIVTGLIQEKFSHDMQLGEKLMPLAKYAQAACNKALHLEHDSAEVTATVARVSPSRATA